MTKGFKYLFFSAILMQPFYSEAKEYTAEKTGKKAPAAVAANCPQPSKSTELAINNVRALIHTGGDMWWNLVGQSQYEVPKGSGRTALFSGSLWIGGVDDAGQLKVAAQRFRANGVDFYTGPLSTLTSEVSSTTCSEYDRFFESTKQEVAEFKSWFEAGQESAELQAELFPNYSVPDFIKEWPAHGRTEAPYNEADKLAPFVDVNDDGVYKFGDGDYPGYNFNPKDNCGQKIVDIYGDKNNWWVFNDKGNIHGETNSDPIGMEIRAQAFAFATNDEVNNMTFYNYETWNRSTFTLDKAYFGFWVDSDLGNSQDDYVGCDVQRGFGYAYNGDEDDEDAGGNKGYGLNPPAIGVDFFQGPFQNDDGKDNCTCNTVAEALKDDGIVYSGSGVGYGDGQVDNERLGMRAFLYHNNSTGNPATQDPTTAADYYNFLRSIWKDGSNMLYNGTGHQSSPNADRNTQALYMFPGDSDPKGWGTGGVPQQAWTEATSNNPVGDRRFIQSAGEFTLLPGAKNNVTVGVVWARATSGGAAASIDKLIKADEKTQALFDQCFQLIDGPDAPNVNITELDRKIIISLDNPSASNNYRQAYDQVDPFIIAPDSLPDENNNYYFSSSQSTDSINTYQLLKREYRSYKFQGYQIFQLKDASVSSGELNEPEKAQLVVQCDIKDGITDIVNYDFDQELGSITPVPKVRNAPNAGIETTFEITQDLFAKGDKELVNYKSYYFMVIAYSYNNFKTYTQLNPEDLDGQKVPYLASRKSALGPIKAYVAIPHKTEMLDGGTTLNSDYGDGIPLTKVEGDGNGGIDIRVDDTSWNPFFDEQNPVNEVSSITYQPNAAPVIVKIIDPLAVVDDSYTLAFKKKKLETGEETFTWELTGDKLESTVESEGTVKIGGEQVIPSLGISITAKDDKDPAKAEKLGFISATIEFEDQSKQWLAGVPDRDGLNYFNWIRSGSFFEAEPTTPDGNPREPYWDHDRDGSSDDLDKEVVDPNEEYEELIGRTWAPSRLTTWNLHGPSFSFGGLPNGMAEYKKMFDTRDINAVSFNANHQMDFLQSVNIYITSDKSKWTRCVVLEAQDDSTLAIGNARKMRPRKSPSVDKDGNPTTATSPSSNPADGNYISEWGMGWFPGYAVNVTTGERLNMAFAEDSYLTSENGDDMIWNPSSTVVEGISGSQIRFGGKHFVYVFRNDIVEEDLTADIGFTLSGGPNYNLAENRSPAYDAGQWMFNQLNTSNLGSNKHKLKVFSVLRASMWTGFPLLVPGREMLESDVTIRLRTTKKFSRYQNGDYLSVNDNVTNGKTYLVRQGPIIVGTETYRRGSTFTAKANDKIEAVLAPNPNPTGTDTRDNLVEVINDALPLFNFKIEGKAPSKNVKSVSENALNLIRLVPNPYYAYSEYEADKNDNRVRITNLPKEAEISIYTLSGALVRRLSKDDASVTYIDWDLKNHARITVASGTYIVHVNVPGVGEKIIKWFGIMRPIDLDSF